jgi:hypothetical protein
MPTTHKIALIAPVDGLTPLSLVASDVNRKLDSVTLGAGLDYGSGGILSLIPSEIDHNSLLNVHQDVNTDASPVFAGATIGSVAIPGVFTAMTEPTGFVDRVATISWDDATYTLTITGNHDIYINGVKTTKTTASIQITDATGLYYIYYNAAGTLTSSTVHPGFALPLMATVYWNTTTDKGLVGEERHGIKMDTDTHTLLHYTVGTRYESGLAGTFADTTFSIAAGVIDDEDITLSITPAKTTCNVLYKDGAAEFKWLAGQTKYYYEDGDSNLNYNNGNTLTPLAANKYMAVWIFATNDTTTPIVSLIGQRTDTTITDARNNNKYESLTLGTLPFQEMKLLYRVILQNTATPYVETQDLRNISNLPAGTYVATAHNVLTGLDYDSAGHTGFAPIASPTFTGTVTLPATTLIPNGGTIGQAAGPLLTFDDTDNELDITGCKQINYVRTGVGAANNAYFILSSENAAQIQFAQYIDAASGGSFVFKKSRGTTAVPTIVSNGDKAGGFFFEAYDGAVFRELGLIMSLVDGVPSAGDMPGSLLFYTTQTGTMTRTERMRIDSVGLVTIAGALTVSGTTTLGSLAGIIKGAAGVLSAVIDGISGQVLMTDGSNNYSWTSACFNLDGGSATTSFIGVGGSPIDGGSA